MTKDRFLVWPVGVTLGVPFGWGLIISFTSTTTRPGALSNYLFGFLGTLGVLGALGYVPQGCSTLAGELN